MTKEEGSSKYPSASFSHRGSCLWPSLHAATWEEAASGCAHLVPARRWVAAGLCCALKPPPGGPAPALTCPLCCSPECSRSGGARSHTSPTPARAWWTRRQQRARRTPSWRWPCSTAACFLRERKGLGKGLCMPGTKAPGEAARLCAAGVESQPLEY